MEPKIDLRDYIRRRDAQFEPVIGERYFKLLIRFACRLGDIDRTALLPLLVRLGWTETTLDYHARLVRNCDSQDVDWAQPSADRLAMLAAAFRLYGWFDDKFPVAREGHEVAPGPSPTTVVFYASPWSQPGVLSRR